MKRGSSRALDHGSKRIGVWIGVDEGKLRRVPIVRCLPGKEGKTYAAAVVDSMLEVAIDDGSNVWKSLTSIGARRSNQWPRSGFVRCENTPARSSFADGCEGRTSEPVLDARANGSETSTPSRWGCWPIAWSGRTRPVAELDRLLWPARCGIAETWIIPIENAELFDRDLASAGLFPMDHTLAQL